MAGGEEPVKEKNTQGRNSDISIGSSLRSHVYAANAIIHLFSSYFLPLPKCSGVPKLHFLGLLKGWKPRPILGEVAASDLYCGVQSVMLLLLRVQRYSRGQLPPARHVSTSRFPSSTTWCRGAAPRR